MGTTRKTIVVTDQQNEWIKAQIGAGGFTNDSEYVRDLIRRDQACNAEIGAVRAELIKGEALFSNDAAPSLPHPRVLSGGALA